MCVSPETKVLVRITEGEIRFVELELSVTI